MPSGWLRYCAPALLILAAGCHGRPAGPDDRSAGNAIAGDAAGGDTPLPAPGMPPPGADVAANAEQILAENDAAIARNKRMITVLGGYARADPARLRRLTAECQAKLGVGPADGARRIFDCVRAGW